jgi:hypothetical protein
MLQKGFLFRDIIVKKEASIMIRELFNPVAWGSPIGLGIFLVCIGLMVYLMSLACRNKKGK